MSIQATFNYSFPIIILLIVLGGAACTTNSKPGIIDPNLPLAEQFKTKKAIRKEIERVNSLIYHHYNLTADEQDKITCGMEKIGKKKRIRVCLTNRHREERAEAALEDICSLMLGFSPATGHESGCAPATAGGYNKKRIMWERAKSQMKRIHYEITMMAQYNIDLNVLMKRALELRALYDSQ